MHHLMLREIRTSHTAFRLYTSVDDTPPKKRLPCEDYSMRAFLLLCILVVTSTFAGCIGGS
jgi:hypothetical protein